MNERARLPYGGLTEHEIEAIAERAAQRALQHVYAEVGKSVLKKLMWAIGTIATVVLMWLAGNGYLKG